MAGLARQAVTVAGAEGATAEPVAMEGKAAPPAERAKAVESVGAVVGWEGGVAGGMAGAVTRTFHYTLRAPDGRVIDTSQGAEPISFVEGSGMIIDGLEEALRELVVGAKARVVVPAARAYGERDEEQVQPVLRALLPVEGELKPGDSFQVGDDVQAPTVTVVSVQGDTVVLDGNHPLAGVDLTFEVEVVAVTAGS